MERGLRRELILQWFVQLIRFVSLNWLCACLCQFFFFQDTGPQLPTNVTAQLKYGTNLLQVMGNFKGIYSIIYIFLLSMFFN